MSNAPSGDAIYSDIRDLSRERGPEKLGPMTSWAFYDDPRRLAFMLSRYKFVSRMLEGQESVLEVGCGDGFGARIVRQAVQCLVAVDFDPEFVNSAKENVTDKWPIDFRLHDMMAGPVRGDFTAVYSLDVLEHIHPNEEDCFIKNMIANLDALPRETRPAAGSS